MTREEFMTMAGKLYDEAFAKTQGQLFPVEEKKPEFKDYKPKRDYVRIGAIAEHYGKQAQDIKNACGEAYIKMLSMENNGRSRLYIKAEDCKALSSHIRRRYEAGRW